MCILQQLVVILLLNWNHILIAENVVIEQIASNIILSVYGFSPTSSNNKTILLVKEKAIRL